MTKKNGFLLIEVTAVSTILLLISSIMAHVACSISKTHSLIECHIRAVSEAVRVSETNIPIMFVCDDCTINTLLSSSNVSIAELPLDKPFLARTIQVTVQKGQVYKKVCLRTGCYNA